MQRARKVLWVNLQHVKVLPKSKDEMFGKMVITMVAKIPKSEEKYLVKLQIQDIVQMLYSLSRGGANVSFTPQGIDIDVARNFTFMPSRDDTISQVTIFSDFNIVILEKQQIPFIHHVIKLGRFYRDKQFHFREQYWLLQLHTNCTMETLYEQQ